MKKGFLITLSILLGFAIPANSLTFPDDYEKRLVPLVLINPVPGAFGSLWKSRVSVANQSDRPVSILGYYANGSCQILCPQPNPVPARATFYPSIILPYGPPATFLWVEKGRSDDVAISLRVQDVSRQADTWGTTVPVLKTEDLFSGRASVLDVPIDPRFRQTLRVYDFHPDRVRTVAIRIFRVDPIVADPARGGHPERRDELLVEFNETFSASDSPLLAPGYIEKQLWLIPELFAAQLVRVEIEPSDSTARFWAFVSVTNNETQHVTTISAQ